jgi:hypothetical protein
VSRGRKVERHACTLIRTCSKGEMESSCASALPVRELENIEAFHPLAAPEIARKRETNTPCPKGIAKSMGARETNMPKERSAAVRRDGEPLTSAAKKRRQKERLPTDTRRLQESNPLHLQERELDPCHYRPRTKDASCETW